MKIKRVHMSSSPKSENFAVSLVPLVVTSIAYSAKALLFKYPFVTFWIIRANSHKISVGTISDI